MKIVGEKIYLRILSPDDVNTEYVEWLKDEEVTQYLELRWKAHTIEDIKADVKRMNESQHELMLGIFLNENNRHIGNIKIGEISPIHRFADIGLLIGDRSMQKRGLGSEAIKLATDYGFRELNLNKLKAGMYEKNTGSYKAFINAKYREVGRYTKHRLYKGEYVDEILLEKNR